jgi:dual specificity MAP kinase phosphatase
MSVTQILDNIWIGDKDAAKSKKFLEENNINIIVNCSKTIRNYYEEQYEYYRVKVNDRLDPNDVIEMKNQIDNVVCYIYSNHLMGKNILIHCRKGKQRSAIVLAVFLTMIYSDKSIFEIMEFIRNKRQKVFNYGTSVNFIDVLLDYQYNKKK